MGNIKLTLEKRSCKFTVTADGRDVSVTRWKQGFKGGKTFEEGFYFDNEAEQQMCFIKLTKSEKAGK